MCIYVERLRNGDVDQMLYKHYGRLCKHGKTSRDAWKDNMSRAIYLWNKRGVMRMYKDYRRKYSLETSAILVRQFAWNTWVTSKLKGRA
tara:strand:+ start:420 stop:686 length:267 start_codon:yes stop_codon:yes gene_type:complete